MPLNRTRATPPATVLALTLALAACNDGVSQPAEPDEPAESETAEAEPDDVDSRESETGEPGEGDGDAPVAGTPIDTSAVNILDDELGENMQWTLDQLAVEGAPTAEEAAERFSDVFLEQLPADQMAATFDQIRALGLTEMTSYEAVADAAMGLLEGPGEEPIEIQLVIDDEGVITGLLFAPMPEIVETETLDGAIEYLDENVETYSILTASVSGGGTDATDPARCDIATLDGEQEAMPIASQFKTWVLAAVVTAVEDGELAWSDELELTDELRSLPSGTLQDEDTGFTLEVEDAALRMIRDSDNTATDMLMDAVGPDRITQAVEDAGHHNPAMLNPMLTTRQMFQLALSGTDAIDEWAAAGGDGSSDADQGVAERQGIVDNLPEWEPEVSIGFGSSTFWDQGADWFATAEDLCNSYAYLWGLSDTEAGEPVGNIMSASPGVDPGDIEDADYLGFKGGSSIGNMSGGWMIERADGQRDIVVVMTATTDPAATMHGAQLSDLAQAAMNQD